MKVSFGEKLILRILCDYSGNKEGEREFDPVFVGKAVSNGYYWALNWEYHIEEHAKNPEVVTETCDILDMWKMIELSYKRLSDEDKESISRDSRITGEADSAIKFTGFDGNQDEHYYIARFMIDEMGLYAHFKGRELNSHNRASIRNYRWMLEIYKPMLKSLEKGQFSADQIIELYTAPWTDRDD